MIFDFEGRILTLFYTSPKPQNPKTPKPHEVNESFEGCAI